MARELKVFGGAEFLRGSSRQEHVIIAAYSWAEAHGILSTYTPIGIVYMKKYWSVTGNEADIAKATSKPGTIFIVENPYHPVPQKHYVAFKGKPLEH